MNQVVMLRLAQKKIPKMECVDGCHDCCKGYAPSMLKYEWMQITSPLKTSQGKTFTSCPFLGDHGCTIYHHRPLICRVFGTVEKMEGVDMFKASCPRGAAPATPMRLAVALKMQADYEGELWTQACMLIARFIAYLKGPKLDRLPVHFEYLRYLFSTQDGQRGLALLMEADSGLHPDHVNRLHEIMIGGQA